MRGAQVTVERIRAAKAAEVLGTDTKLLKRLTERGLIPEAALLGTTYTYREQALVDFRPQFEQSKDSLVESLKPPRVETVYVIRCGYRVKIGFTRNIAQRLHSLKTANHRPMELLTSWPAPQTEEKALHARFADLRVSGEWFALRKPIKEWLREEHRVSIF